MKVRQESIDLLKGRLRNQITSFKETIAKVLHKDTSLGEKIRTLFREQGIVIASILTAIRMAIGVLVEALLLGGGAAAASGGEPPPKDEKGWEGWIRNKLKVLASLLGKLGMKAAEALPGIIKEHPTSCSAKKLFYSGYFAEKIDPVLCVAGKMKYIVGIITLEVAKFFLRTSDNL